MLTHGDIYGLIGLARARGYKQKDIAQRLAIRPETLSHKANSSLNSLTVQQASIPAELAGCELTFKEARP